MVRCHPMGAWSKHTLLVAQDQTMSSGCLGNLAPGQGTRHFLDPGRNPL